MQRTLLSLALFIFSSITHAESDRSDCDLDDDGFLEINDLQDLDEIPNHLNGAALCGRSEGCPADGCVGFELTADLDFDTNKNGMFDEQDVFWNHGEGWRPFGQAGGNSFEAIFDGNHFSILNLNIHRPEEYQGLFGITSGAVLRNLKIKGSHSSISGAGYVGGLAGYTSDTEIKIFYCRARSVCAFSPT